MVYQLVKSNHLLSSALDFSTYETEVNLNGLSQKEIGEARKEANFLANLNHPNIVR